MAYSFGHKLHVDQNEKLVDFGVTHVAAIDGYSRYVVSYQVMPVKNNLIIYEDILKKAVESHGVWMQLRLDGGQEFNLIEYMQCRLADLRVHSGHKPVLRTQSKLNLRIERLWREVNMRVNYPIKTDMQQLVDNDILDIENDTHKYVLSIVLIPIVSYGMEMFVKSWNHHRVDKNRHSHEPTGKPYKLMCDRDSLADLPSDIVLPNATDAAFIYEEDTGGHLSRESRYGRLPDSVSNEQ